MMTERGPLAQIGRGTGVHNAPGAFAVTASAMEGMKP